MNTALNIICTIAVICLIYQILVNIILAAARKRDEKKAARDAEEKENQQIRKFLLQIMKEKGCDNHDTHYDI